MFNFGIKQVYEARWESNWLKILYSDGRYGWLWRNLSAFEPEIAVWLPLEPLSN